MTSWLKQTDLQKDSCSGIFFREWDEMWYVMTFKIDYNPTNHRFLFIDLNGLSRCVYCFLSKVAVISLKSLIGGLLKDIGFGAS